MAQKVIIFSFEIDEINIRLMLCRLHFALNPSKLHGRTIMIFL